MAPKFEFTAPVQYYGKKNAYELSTPFGDWVLETQPSNSTNRNKLVKISTHPIKNRDTIRRLKVDVKFYGGVASIKSVPEFILGEEAVPVIDPSDHSIQYVTTLRLPNDYNTKAHMLQYYFKILFEEKRVWEDFVEPPAPLPNSALSYMSSLFDSNKFADITIKTADGKKVKAAKFALSRSSVFDAMLNRHDTKEAKTGVIQITDIDHEVMKELIRYMYSDEVPKLKEIALELMIAANKYDLPGLFELCKKYLMANISLDTFANVLIYADKLEIEDLEKAIIQYILVHNETVLASDEWKRLKENHVQVAMKVLEHRFKASK